MFKGITKKFIFTSVCFYNHFKDVWKHTEILTGNYLKVDQIAVSMTEGQSQDLLKERKEKVVTYLKEKKDWFQYLILALIIWIGAYVRGLDLPNLKDITTGLPISLELDSTLWLRYARAIVEHGSLFKVDPLRYVPLGADIRNLATFTSYFIAYLYKILHVFNSSVTIGYANNVYPIVATAIMTFFLFLLVRRLFDWKTALVACAFINVSQTFFFRSLGGSSDHDILGAMWIIMAFYFYVRGWQSKKKVENRACAVLAALITSLATITAGSYTFILMVIGAVNLFEIFLNKFEQEDYYNLLTYLVSFMLFFKIFNSTNSIVPLFTSLTTGSVYLALAIGTINWVVFKKRWLDKISYVHKYKEKVPEGIFSFVLGVLILLIGATLIFGPSFFIEKIGDLYSVVFKAFNYSRWALTVAENKTPYVKDWFDQMGTLYVWGFIIGSVLLFYNAVKNLKRALPLTGAYTFFIFGYIFSRYSGDSILNGSSLISKGLFYAAILVFIGVIVYEYWKMFKSRDGEFEKIKEINRRYAFVLMWFLIMILAAASAIRLLFDFTPITTIIAAFLVASIFDYFYSLKNVYLRNFGIFALALVLLSPFSFAQGILISEYHASEGQARSAGPQYNAQWQEAGAWVRTNTPPNAVFAHWWDYGYWVQEGFQRATITDGGNFFGWWNYLMGRNVLTGQSDEEALPYLYAHNATHLLVLADDVGKYPAYASIGSDKNYDRYSFINTFGLDKQNSIEKRDETVLLYQGGFPLDEDLILNGKVYPASQAGIGAVIVNMKQNGQNTDIGQPRAAVVYQDQRVDLPIRCIFINGQLIEFNNYSLDGCFRVIPVINSPTQIDPIGAGFWLSNRTYHSRVGQYYILNQESKNFKLVYDDSSKIPLAIYQGHIIGPMKIWEIKYPQGLTLSDKEKEYYLRTDYPDEELLKPR